MKENRVSCSKAEVYLGEVLKETGEGLCDRFAVIGDQDTVVFVFH